MFVDVFKHSRVLFYLLWPSMTFSVHCEWVSILLSNQWITVLVHTLPLSDSFINGKNSTFLFITKRCWLLVSLLSISKIWRPSPKQFTAWSRIIPVAKWWSLSRRLSTRFEKWLWRNDIPCQRRKIQRILDGWTLPWPRTILVNI